VPPASSLQIRCLRELAVVSEGGISAFYGSIPRTCILLRRGKVNIIQTKGNIMTPENFCYWLQGLLEIGDPSELDSEQVEIIKEHLNLVFKKETKVAKPTLSDWLKTDSPVNDRFIPKMRPPIYQPDIPTPDYLRPWSSPTIIC
jgi:hypothetical protein